MADLYDGDEEQGHEEVDGDDVGDDGVGDCHDYSVNDRV